MGLAPGHSHIPTLSGLCGAHAGKRAMIIIIAAAAVKSRAELSCLPHSWLSTQSQNRDHGEVGFPSIYNFWIMAGAALSMALFSRVTSSSVRKDREQVGDHQCRVPSVSEHRELTESAPTPWRPLNGYFYIYSLSHHSLTR